MGSLRETISKGMRVVWWISFVWLAVALVGELWWFVSFLMEPDNPARGEAGIGALIFLFYSWPAVVCMLVAALVPNTRLSTAKRLIGVALLLSCVATVFLFKWIPLLSKTKSDTSIMKTRLVSGTTAVAVPLTTEVPRNSKGIGW